MKYGRNSDQTPRPGVRVTLSHVRVPMSPTNCHVSEEELRFDEITVDSLKAEKGFAKVGRKQPDCRFS